MNKIFDIQFLLQQEQYKLEKIIAVVRLIIYTTFFIITIITDLIIKDDPYHNHVLLFLGITCIAFVLAAEVYIVGRRFFMNRIYTLIHNSMIPLLDILMVAYIVTTITAHGPIQTIPSQIKTVMQFNYIYLMATAIFTVMNLVRFNVISSAITGVSLSCIFLYLQHIHFGHLDVMDGFISLGDKLYFVSTVTIMTIISILAARRIQSLLIKSKKQESLNRFLPDSLAREMMKTESSILLQGERITATVLFSDIRSFTSLSETMQPEEVISFLNTYFDMMIQIVFQHNGTLDKLTGDGMMAVFGAFYEGKGNSTGADDAVQAAAAMRMKLRDFNRIRHAHGLSEIESGIGIHTGEIIIGGVGTKNRMDFTSIGDTVNTASRLESLTKEVGASVLVSEDTKECLDLEYVLTDRGEYELKGKRKRIRIFSLEKDECS